MRRCTGIALIAAAALALSGCSGSGGATTADATAGDGLTPVKIAGVVTTSTVPIWVAQSEGIFEEHGLEVEMEPVQNFAAAAPSLLNGQLQFAIAATSPVIVAISEGMPLRAVVGTSATVEDPEAEGNQLVVPADSPLTDITDLAGKKVGTNQVGSGPYAAALASYVRAGGDPEAIEWVSMPMNEQLLALENGQLDAAVLAEPFTASALAEGNRPLVSLYRDPGNEVLAAEAPYVTIISSESYLAEHADVAERLRAAMIEANAVASERPELVIEGLVEQTDMDPEAAERLVLPAFVGEMTGEEMQDMADAMIDAGIIPGPFDGAAAVWQP
ncbi:ABC transporter substrate-binding protein [Leucobacter allii]|uniref:ABC transporter substrate-binding protein n=1 Tax=Leucobacter allii TaxID=2932247 RepID=UPI001FD1BAD1|nr:ABC transporter substrate-binding protein [Leucobacter allii]UOR03310.1 ABC transporter substrate-binding protein [Leucobacter allii]